MPDETPAPPPDEHLDAAPGTAGNAAPSGDLDAAGLKGALGRTGRMLKTAGLPFDDDEFDEDDDETSSSSEGDSASEGSVDATGETDAADRPPSDAVDPIDADDTPL